MVTNSLTVTKKRLSRSRSLSARASTAFQLKTQPPPPPPPPPPPRRRVQVSSSDEDDIDPVALRRQMAALLQIGATRRAALPEPAQRHIVRAAESSMTGWRASQPPATPPLIVQLAPQRPSTAPPPNRISLGPSLQPPTPGALPEALQPPPLIRTASLPLGRQLQVAAGKLVPPAAVPTEGVAYMGPPPVILGTSYALPLPLLQDRAGVFAGWDCALLPGRQPSTKPAPELGQTTQTTRVERVGGGWQVRDGRGGGKAAVYKNRSGSHVHKSRGGYHVSSHGPLLM